MIDILTRIEERGVNDTCCVCRKRSDWYGGFDPFRSVAVRTCLSCGFRQEFDMGILDLEIEWKRVDSESAVIEPHIGERAR